MFENFVFIFSFLRARLLHTELFILRFPFASVFIFLFFFLNFTSEIYLQHAARQTTDGETVGTRDNLHVVYVLVHYFLVASFLDPVCFFFTHFMLPLKANGVQCERKVCLCNESSVWHGSRRRRRRRRRPRNAHFILEEPFLCNRVNGGARMIGRERERERLSFCGAAIIIIITNDTVNRFPLYIACNNDILLFASNLPFSIFVLHTHISHYPNHEHARTHCGQCIVGPLLYGPAGCAAERNDGSSAHFRMLSLSLVLLAV